jgi:hypothetical protein
MLAGQLRPVNTLAKIPMILPGATETASGPLSEIHEYARQITRDDNAILGRLGFQRISLR